MKNIIAIGDLNCERAPDVNVITVEMLKYGGGTITDWNVLCNLGWKEERVHEDWTNTIDQVSIGKINRNEGGMYF